MTIIALGEEFVTQRSLKLGVEALQTHRFTMETSKELIQGDVVGEPVRTLLQC